MSIKYFCDCCDREIARNYVSPRLAGHGWVNDRKVKLELHVGTGEHAMNFGHLCLHCLRLALTDLFLTEVNRSMNPVAS